MGVAGGEEAFLPPNLAPFQLGVTPFRSAIGSFARSTEGRPTDRPTEPPDKLALDCKHLRNLYPADEKEGRRERGKGWQSAVVIAHCRTEPTRVGEERNKRIRRARRALILNFTLNMGNFFN